MRRRVSILVLSIALFLVFTAAGCTGNKNPEVILATTTSTVDSGLLDVLKPEFEKETGYDLTIVSVGTGQALDMGEKGEADALLVHAPASEKPLVDSGIAINYQLVMHNDFLLIGPPSDPAKVKGKTVEEALKAIAASRSLFVSRGDESGTHKKELAVWKAIGVTPEGSWYQETGSGMGQTINVAAEKSGYTLTDRATYLAQKRNMDLEIVVEGDKILLNIYHAMQVNPEKFAKVTADGGRAFVEFMISTRVQEIIGKFGIEEFGEPLFVPDAGKSEAEIGK